MGSKFLSSVLVLISVCSCTLFSPREAEPPAGSDFWMEPFSPGVSVMNFVNSVENKSAANYARSLDEGFVYVPYFPDTFGSGGLFKDWGKQKESEYAGILFSRVQSPFIVLSPVQRDSTDSSAIFYYNYEFFGDSQAEGLVLFYLTADFSGVWSIVKIEDLGGKEPTWTKQRKDIYEHGFGNN